MEENKIELINLIALFCDKEPTSLSEELALATSAEAVKNIVIGEEADNKSDYYTDVKLSTVVKGESAKVEITGYADGIETGDVYRIDKVCSVKLPLDLVDKNIISSALTYARSLAFILARSRSKERVDVRIIAVNPESFEKRYFDFSYTLDDLHLFFSEIVLSIGYICENDSEKDTRNKSLEELKFPYPQKRSGQDIMMKAIYRAISEKNNIYINAPTGIGKTVGTIFPALKAMSKDKCDKIYYLTPKNSVSKVALDGFFAFCKNGAKIKVLSIIAKTKLCPNGECSYKSCPYMKGHAKKIKEAVKDIVGKESFYTYDIIRKYSSDFEVCPYELAFSLSEKADVIVCDYNYIFDPVVRKNLGHGRNNVFLVDEAHNLVERIREIYSARIDIPALKKQKENFDGVLSELSNELCELLASAFESYSYEPTPIDFSTLDEIDILSNRFFEELQKHVKKNPDDESLLDFFYDFKNYIRVAGERDDSFIAYFSDKGELRLFIADTGEKTVKSIENNGSAVFFSATLLPDEYYRHMLGCRKDNEFLILDSPFCRENLLVLSSVMSTKYSEREMTVKAVAEMIHTCANTKVGNYMAFFPSYNYMKNVYAVYQSIYPDDTIIIQKQNMTRTMREEFLKHFSNEPEKTLVGFAVMGGSFSEGVDLAGDRLSGAFIVGIGVLPPDIKRDFAAMYFNDRFFEGGKFAYLWPGINKVFQAGGRVIRTETDRGFLVVIDDRFLSEDYLDMLPNNWKNIKKVKNSQMAKEELELFWTK